MSSISDSKIFRLEVIDVDDESSIGLQPPPDPEPTNTVNPADLIKVKTELMDKENADDGQDDGEHDDNDQEGQTGNPE